MYKLIKIPDLITLLNLLCGLGCIYYSYLTKFTAAAIFLLICVVFDYLDGKVARLTKRKGGFGKQLDSLSDIISFGIAPAVFGYILLNTATNKIFLFVVLVLFIFAGVLRLARFNIIKIKGHYKGLPITSSGIIVPILYFINFPLNYFVYVYLILAVLMVSPIKFKKIDIKFKKSK